MEKVTFIMNISIGITSMFSVIFRNFLTEIKRKPEKKKRKSIEEDESIFG